MMINFNERENYLKKRNIHSSIFIKLYFNVETSARYSPDDVRTQRLCVSRSIDVERS